jgi:hypothetical protein
MNGDYESHYHGRPLPCDLRSDGHPHVFAVSETAQWLALGVRKLAAPASYQLPLYWCSDWLVYRELVGEAAAEPEEDHFQLLERYEQCSCWLPRSVPWRPVGTLSCGASFRWRLPRPNVKPQYGRADLGQALVGATI